MHCPPLQNKTRTVPIHQVIWAGSWSKASKRNPLEITFGAWLLTCNVPRYVCTHLLNYVSKGCSVAGAAQALAKIVGKDPATLPSTIQLVGQLVRAAGREYHVLLFGPCHASCGDEVIFIPVTRERVRRVGRRISRVGRRDPGPWPLPPFPIDRSRITAVKN